MKQHQLLLQLKLLSEIFEVDEVEADQVDERCHHESHE
jgi:hypothetical protein